MEVPAGQEHMYGVVAGEQRGGVVRVSHMVEKPAPGTAPSRLAIVGRYVLPGRIFELLENTTPGAGGEIQLTDAIEMLLSEQPVLAYRFEGTRFDCGNKLGLVKATLHMALQDPTLADATRKYMEELGPATGGQERR
jgi:UTP--glucose-1-phosphate uridylyltransferase